MEHAPSATPPRLPSWAVKPREPVTLADVQWSAFKQHLGSWNGLSTQTPPAGGAPQSVTRALRHYVLRPGDPHEAVHHEHIVAQVAPRRDARAGLGDDSVPPLPPPRVMHFRHTALAPPVFSRPVRPDGSLADPLPGVWFFSPAGAGAWTPPSIAAPSGRFAVQRFMVHPHRADARLTIGATYAPRGDGGGADGGAQAGPLPGELQFVTVIRDEAVAPDATIDSCSRGSLDDEAGLFGDTGVFAGPLAATAVAPADSGAQGDRLPRPAAPAGSYGVVAHTARFGGALEARVYRSPTGPPALAGGPDCVALQFADGVLVSVPRAIGPGLVGRGAQIETMWRVDRGCWLHSRLEYGADGEFERDCLDVYYPLDE